MTRAFAITGVVALLLLPVVLLGGAVGGLTIGSTVGAGWTAGALHDIPSAYRLLYEQAVSECPSLHPAVLAAIGKIESDHGRSQAPGVQAGLNEAGCCAGPMQFNLLDGPPSTWERYRRPGDDVYDPADAIPAAVRKLCADGLDQPTVQGHDPCPEAPGTVALHRALHGYNHACAYITAVITQALAYSLTALASPASLGGAQALLTNSSVRLSANARADLAAGIVDARVIVILEALADRYPPIGVSVLKTGHSVYIAGTRTVSEHAYGRAADLFTLAGHPVSAANPAARDAVAWLASLSGPVRPAEVGSPFPEFEPIDGWFHDPAHRDHIHIGYTG